jgi:enterochelin esterase-like enzyme
MPRPIREYAWKNFCGRICPFELDLIAMLLLGEVFAVNSIFSGAVLAALIFVSQPLMAQTGSLEHIKVHGKLLEGNLEGDSPDRDVSVYLPPGYKKNSKQRYPVVYFLHGYTDSDDKWMGPTKHWINLPSVIDKALAGKESREMIVVMPNGFTRYHGSMYSNSVTTGNWEDFVAQELTAYVDSRYRTLAIAASRGLAGHSMGGYGAMRIGMKHPEIFSAVYLLSPCCLTAPDAQHNSVFLEKAAAVKDLADVEKAEFVPRIMLASAAAWSPNAKNPPLYLDLPWKEGQFQADIAQKWAANAPLVMLDQYVTNLKRLKALAFDAGDKDQPIAANIATLDGILNTYSVTHSFEVYGGDHVDHIAERIETYVLPFFSKNLSFAAEHK